MTAALYGPRRTNTQAPSQFWLAWASAISRASRELGRSRRPYPILDSPRGRLVIYEMSARSVRASLAGQRLSARRRALAQRARAALADDGVIAVRGLIPELALQAARARAIAICQREGFCNTAGLLRAGRFDEGPSMRAIRSCQQEWSTTQEYRALLAHQNVVRILSSLLQDRVVQHPRRIARFARIVLPSRVQSQMRTHRDFDYVGPPEDTYTVWIPIAGCSRDRCAPAFLLGSQRGRPARWRRTHCSYGDVLIFNSLVLHRPARNDRTRLIRMSIDFRYCQRRLLGDDILSSPLFGELP